MANQTVRKPTLGQVARITQLIASKKIPYDDLQAIIDKYTPIPTAEEAQDFRHEHPETANFHDVMFWNERFPGCGADIMDILRPFTVWQPVLKAAPADLQERAKAFDFVRIDANTSGVRVYTESNIDQLEADLRLSLGLHVQSTMNSVVIGGLSDYRRSLLMKTFTAAVVKPLQKSFQDTCMPVIRREGKKDDPNDALFQSLMTSLLCAIGSVVLGRKDWAEKFKQILAFWIDGYLPVGFNHDLRDILFLTA